MLAGMGVLGARAVGPRWSLPLAKAGAGMTIRGSTPFTLASSPRTRGSTVLNKNCPSNGDRLRQASVRISSQLLGECEDFHLAFSLAQILYKVDDGNVCKGVVWT